MAAPHVLGLGGEVAQELREAQDDERGPGQKGAHRRGGGRREPEVPHASAPVAPVDPLRVDRDDDDGQQRARVLDRRGESDRRAGERVVARRAAVGRRRQPRGRVEHARGGERQRNVGRDVVRVLDVHRVDGDERGGGEPRERRPAPVERGEPPAGEPRHDDRGRADRRRHRPPRAVDRSRVERARARELRVARRDPDRALRHVDEQVDRRLNVDVERRVLEPVRVRPVDRHPQRAAHDLALVLVIEERQPEPVPPRARRECRERDDGERDGEARRSSPEVHSP